MGHLMFSRVATGRKMGYAYRDHRQQGCDPFRQEDQNALWLYKMDDAPDSRVSKDADWPAHPDYARLCQGPGHGTGYQDQIIDRSKGFSDGD